PVRVGAGTAVRRYKLIKSDGPEDLVFQSVRDGKPMRDNNILSRFIKPAARKLGLGFVNWRCLRTSYGTWLKRGGADMQDIQGQMPGWRGEGGCGNRIITTHQESRHSLTQSMRCPSQCKGSTTASTPVNKKADQLSCNGALICLNSDVGYDRLHTVEVEEQIVRRAHVNPAVLLDGP